MVLSVQRQIVFVRRGKARGWSQGEKDPAVIGGVAVLSVLCQLVSARCRLVGQTPSKAWFTASL